MSSDFTNLLAALASGAAIALSAAAEAADPPPERSVSQWAQDERYVGDESGSRFTGKWDNDRVPHMVEVMDVCGVDHPARHVGIRGGAQTSKSEAVANALYHCLCTAPRSCLVLLPTQEEFSKWNRVKFNTTLEATPALQKAVVGTRQRSEDSSTTAYKRLRGEGFVQLTTASSSKGLQGLPVAFVIREEVTEYPDEVGGRGDPITQSDARMDAQGDEGKAIDVSTPGRLGECKITQIVEAGDYREPIGECPHCGSFIQLDFSRMDAAPEDLEDGGPGPHFTPPCCEEPIYEHHRAFFVRDGLWVVSYRAPDPDAPDDDNREDPANPRPPEVMSEADLPRFLSRESHIRRYGEPGGRPVQGRSPSFSSWQAYSKMGSWRRIWNRWLDAQGNPEKLRTFNQQVLGQPHEDRGDAPNHQLLHTEWVKADLTPGVVPDWACVVTGFCDVQGDRLEWGAYAWGPGPRGQWIAGDIIPGDPESVTTWSELGRVVRMKFPGVRTQDLGFDRFLVDAGFKSNFVYLFASGYPHVMATKGQADPYAAELGAPTKVKAKIGGRVMAATELYPLGQHGLKKRIYFGLKQGMRELDQGVVLPGALRFAQGPNHEFFKQITSGFLNPKHKFKGQPVWEKSYRADEQLDIAVGALAAAVNVGVDMWDQSTWIDVFKARERADLTPDIAPLEQLWADPGEKAGPEQIIEARKEIVKPVDLNPSAAPRRPAWLDRLSDINKG